MLGRIPKAHGFTILELLATLIIAAVVVAIAIPTYSTITNNAKLNAASTEAKAVDRNVRLYAQSDKGLPSDTYDQSEFVEYVSSSLSTGPSPAVTAAWIPGNSTSQVATPNNATLNMAGSIDLRICAAPNSWRPAGNAALIAKYPSSSYSYYYYLDSGGHQRLSLRPSSGTGVGVAATVPMPNVPGIRACMRTTWNQETKVLLFYTSENIEGPWTQLGDTQVLDVPNIATTTTPVTVGKVNSASSPNFIGYIYQAQIRNGIDGAIVANPDFTTAQVGGTSLVDSTGKTWTTAGTAAFQTVPVAKFHPSRPCFAYDTGDAWARVDYGAFFGPEVPPVVDVGLNQLACS